MLNIFRSRIYTTLPSLADNIVIDCADSKLTAASVLLLMFTCTFLPVQLRQHLGIYGGKMVCDIFSTVLFFCSVNFLKVTSES